jgi:hypothetical protein
MSWNLEASASWNPHGLSRPVMGLFYPLLPALRKKISPWSVRAPGCVYVRARLLACSSYILFKQLPDFHEAWEECHIVGHLTNIRTVKVAESSNKKAADSITVGRYWLRRKSIWSAETTYANGLSTITWHFFKQYSVGCKITKGQPSSNFNSLSVDGLNLWTNGENHVHFYGNKS